MARDNINDILVFLAVARERSFTRAAAKLGMTQSALSHIIRGLEARLGVRLLTRTTRSVSPTEAGERLLQNVAPRLEEIEAEIAAVSDLGDKPAGTIRITAIDHVIDTCCGRASRRCCRSTPTCTSRSAPTTASSTSPPNATTSACAGATRSTRT
jgi:DNA-binding transcriptional LysR family regulator